MRTPVTITHRLRSSKWRAAPLGAAVLSDLHVVAPWTSLRFIASVVERVNALRPDIILLPGDFLADRNMMGNRAAAEDIVQVLSALQAQLGVHASLGNHDWKDCDLARSTNARRNSMAEAFARSPVHLYENDAADLGPFWIAGVDSSQGFGSTRFPKPRHDLGAALGSIPVAADVILLSHEPDVWVTERPDVALTVSGHTHGGQLTVGNWRPLTPSRYGATYAHGAFWDDGRALVVSGGLGYTAVPIRLGVPPEITMIELSGT